MQLKLKNRRNTHLFPERKGSILSKGCTASKGFTLIELLVVTSLLVFLLVSISSLFMTFILGSTKVNTRNLVKSEGRHALNQMEFIIRNSVELAANGAGQTCQIGMNRLALISKDGRQTEFRLLNGRIASDSANTANLTSESVTISNGPTFEPTHGYDHANNSWRKGNVCFTGKILT